jgi:hypothetical protein
MILKLQIIFQFLEWLGHLGPFGTDRPLSLLSSPGKVRFCQKNVTGVLYKKQKPWYKHGS